MQERERCLLYAGALALEFLKGDELLLRELVAQLPEPARQARQEAISGVRKLLRLALRGYDTSPPERGPADRSSPPIRGL